MDNSDNSGSVQSSSGGDDQDHYDHRQPNLLNHNPLSFQPNNFFDHQTSNLNFLQQQYQPNPTTTTTTNLDIANPPLTLFHATSPHGQPRSDQNNIGVMKKNPKKRTRASRRAPTTVLTTDTSNFRQMVQEFIGIPAPPFSGLPYSRRLDLFRSSSSRPPIYSDPHHHKVNIETQPNPPHHHHFSLLINNNNAINIMSSSTSNNFSQLIGSDHNLDLHNKTLFNDHQPNQILSFQSSFNPLVFEDQTKKMNFSSSASSSAHEHEKGNTPDPWIISPPE